MPGHDHSLVPKLNPGDLGSREAFFLWNCPIVDAGLTIRQHVIEVFQEYERAMSVLTMNRNFLSDSYGDFLFNNDEFLWNPMMTYHKKRLFVQLMSIMDHYGYATRPLVEYNLDFYNDRASFLGWLEHMSEKKRLTIILDPAASNSADTKNKRVQVTSDLEKKVETEPEMVPAVGPPPVEPIPDSGSKKSSKRRRKSSRKPKEKDYKEYSDSEEDTKSSKGLKRPKSKSSPSKGSSRSGTTTAKPNTSSYGEPLDKGGKCPKHLYPSKQEASDSDVDVKAKFVGKGAKTDGNSSHGDSYTDS